MTYVHISYLLSWIAKFEPSDVISEWPGIDFQSEPKLDAIVSIISDAEYWNFLGRNLKAPIAVVGTGLQFFKNALKKV